MPIPIDQFGKSVVASGLLSADELKRIWADLAADARPKDGERFAKLLVDLKKLTPFQAFEILAGRGSRLVMGEYSIVSQIGAGGMGQVFKAQHRRMKRIVALKVMSGAAMKDAAAVKRFQREVEAAARLEHANIVTAYDSGDHENVKYLVMQFVDGGDLSELVKRKGPLPVDRAIGYILQTARGLSYAHSRGVIHRDIKPANLLLHKDGTVKVLDMGLARMDDAGGELTATEQVMGTVDYMSPEQASDTKNVDGRADIYALGCTLWFLLTGRKMYDGDTMIIRLMKHRDAPLPSLVKEREDIPWPLEQAFHRMIAKRPADRFQSMDEVITALTPYAESADSVLSQGGGGGSSLLRNAEMASFMQAMGSGVGLGSSIGMGSGIGAGSGIGMGSGIGTGSSPSLHSKPASGSRLDLTSHVGGPESETDPGRSSLSKGSGSNVFAPASSSKVSIGASSPSVPKQPAYRSQKKLIGAGVGAAALVVIVGLVFALRGGPKDAGATSGNGVASAGGGASLPAAAVASIPARAIPAPTGVSNDAVIIESLNYAWTPPESLGATVNSHQDDEYPSLSADELRLVFVRRGQGGPHHFMECRRASRDEPFGEAVRINGPNGEDTCLSADGLMLFYATNNGDRKFDLRFRARATRDSPWSNPQSFDIQINTDQDDRQPWISPDFLTLTYSSAKSGGYGERDIWICRRRSISDPWGAPVNAGNAVNGSTAEGDSRYLSDGRTMLFSRNGRQHITFVSGTGKQGSLALTDFPTDARELWFTADGTRMYFQWRKPGSPDYDLFVSRRVKKSELAAESAIPTFSAGGAKPLSTAPAPTSTDAASLTPYELLTSPEFEWSPPVNLGSTVNGPDEDRHPYLSADGLTLMFDSNRAGGVGDYDIWESRRSSPDGAWPAPVNLGPTINKAKTDESPSLCDDGLSLFFSGIGHEGAISTVHGIVNARRKSKDAAWETPVALNQTINGQGTTMSPKVSFDGLTLIYGSTGGLTMGGSDLWWSKRKSTSEGFVASSNFRGPISSNRDERDACFSSDGRAIIFASDRGGNADLWMTVRISLSDAWSDPVRLDELAGASHDAGPALSFDGRTLFFHSNRNGSGKLDLFMTQRLPRKPAGGK